ncbi:MAG: putative lipid II flippase FtsW [Acidimicrobiales bacterium]
MGRHTIERGRRTAGHRAAPRPRSGLLAAARQLPTSTVLVGLVVVLCVFGVAMVGSASEVVSIVTYGTSWAILLRECLWLVLGLVVFGFACRTDYRRWRRWSGVLMAVTIFLLLAVLVPGLGTTSGGSTRWLGFGPLLLQPSELMKLALALAGADLVARRERADGGHRMVVGPLLLLTALAGGLVLVQPDMGTALVLGAITLALLFASGVPTGPIVKLLMGLGGLALVVGLADPYRRARLLSFLDPRAHASGSGYQVFQSLIGLGSGHIFGVGFGNGREKWGYLPNAHTDFIFSVVGEELGLVGALCVLGLLFAFVWFGLRAAARAPDRFGGLLGVGLVAWIAAETLINVGAVVGLLPVTGIPLPFISYGGSSLVLTLLAAGILVSIARQEVPDPRPAGLGTGRAGAGRAGTGR